MFVGQYEHAIDGKGRIAIPAKYRRSFASGAIVTKGLDGCLFLFSKAKWQKMAENIGQLPTTKSSARLYARLILAGATEVNFDKQGRVILPSYLRRYAGITSEAIVTGIYDRLEIWNPKTWEEISQKFEKEAGKIVEDLSDLGV